VHSFVEGINQHDEVVVTFKAMNFIAVRPAAAGESRGPERSPA
jgi:hypothetical protein